MPHKGKSITVIFDNAKVHDAYEELKRSKGEDALLKALNKAFDALKRDPFCGIQIPKRQFPRAYRNLDNLWKYELPSGWRMLYYVKGDNVNILAVILEWIDHKRYDRLFGY
ncbi:MAG: hypothetical protein L0Z54_02755 [Thermoplasmata archaeon]|nr:hypothetical protein [Thermoplasmata archaeon]